MEPRYFLSCLAMLGAGALAAQPTLTAANNVPAAGASFPISLGSSFDSPGPSGASQLYGFWMLPASGNRTIHYRAASVTPTSAQMPTATLLSTDGGTDTLFWAVTGNGLEMVGERTAALGVVPFTDALIEIKYPCSFGTTWSDPFGASYTISGIVPVTRTGTVSGNANGHGTLELPQVAVNNVLRVKVRRVSQDVSMVATVDRVNETHYFFTDTVPYPVLKLTVDTVIFSGGAPTVTRSAEWMYGAGRLGLDDLSYDDVRFTAYPNPASGPVHLSMAGNARARFVEVFDATGRAVMATAVPIGVERVEGAFDVGALAPGVYHVRVSGDAGALGTQRLVVE